MKNFLGKKYVQIGITAFCVIAASMLFLSLIHIFIMLLIVRFFGDSAGGATRWLDLGFVRFQPTELSKILLIMFFARFLMDHEDTLNTCKTVSYTHLDVYKRQCQCNCHIHFSELYGNGRSADDGRR